MILSGPYVRETSKRTSIHHTIVFILKKCEVTIVSELEFYNHCFVKNIIYFTMYLVENSAPIIDNSFIYFYMFSRFFLEESFVVLNEIIVRE